MAGISIQCTRCEARLKAPAGKQKVRCPRCGTAIQVPPPAGAQEEVLEVLEEVDEEPRRRARVDRDDDEPRPRRPRRVRRLEEEGDGPWLIAVAVAAACFFLSFGVTLLSYGFQGLPENQQEGGFVGKLAALAFGVVVALVLVALGAVGVKNRKIYDRWGNVTSGPFAVVLAMVIVVTGSSLGGFVMYGLLLGLIQGK